MKNKILSDKTWFIIFDLMLAIILIGIVCVYMPLIASIASIYLIIISKLLSYFANALELDENMEEVK